MLKKIIKRIEKERNSGNIFWKYVVILTDLCKRLIRALNLKVIPFVHRHQGLSDYKYKRIEALFKKHRYNDIYIETGLQYGNTVFLAKKVGFKKNYSIEIDKSYVQYCAKKFKNYEYIRLVLGDSARKLTEVLDEIDKPCTIWLDAHSSCVGGELCPILLELETIGTHHIKTHTILIDDRRLFGKKENFPVEKEIIASIKKINADYKIAYSDGRIDNDIIVASI